MFSIDQKQELAGLAERTIGVLSMRTTFSDASISSKLPPRCTVAARKQPKAFHGMDAFSA